MVFVVIFFVIFEIFLVRVVIFLVRVVFFCDFAILCCVLVVKISLYLRFRFGFIVDNKILVLIPLFCVIKLIISLDSSIVKSKRFKSIDSIYISSR